MFGIKKQPMSGCRLVINKMGENFIMNYHEPLTVLEILDMDEQQLLLTCLLMALGTEKTYEIAMQAVSMLKENNREDVAGLLEKAARKMTA
ncbi:MAG: hypothetical protein JL50_12815 [Peptococcaceae bacterium BICA1-7]|nr:MAG: hypothetical protein JL50_12815 [Peptococcaceae bacterium BICA1-7]HBV97281.1 hypothetical protein [Desulfotomaculum sp.]